MRGSSCAAAARWLVALLITLGQWPGSVLAQQDVVADFAAGPGNGTYRFASWTPKTIGELMKGSAGAAEVAVVGHLFLPEGKDRVGAVVFLHGSGGIYKAMLDYWPRTLNAAGLAVFALDSFGPRGVPGGTADDQGLVPPAADTADVFAALRLLASHPRIDPQRIALIGASRGGIAAIRANAERVVASQKLPGGLRYAALVPLYTGGCVGLARLAPNPGVFGKAPMLFVHGDADDYTPLAPCREYAEQIGKAGTPVQFVALPGAHHRFDDDNTRRRYNPMAQRTLATCPLEFDLDKGVIQDRFTREPIPGDQWPAIHKKSCSALGASVEGNPGHRAKAADAIVAFLKSAFAK